MSNFFLGPAAGFSTPYFPSSVDAFYGQQQQAHQQQQIGASRHAFAAQMPNVNLGYEPQFAAQSQYSGAFVPQGSSHGSWEDQSNRNVGFGQQTDAKILHLESAFY
jgi:hypothetical protein